MTRANGLVMYIAPLTAPKHFISTKAYAAHTQNTPLAPFSFERRDPTPNDVQIEILFAAFAIPICTSRATNGAAPPIPACRDTKSSGAWSKSGRM